MKVQELIDKISAYKFNCEAGSLSLCVDYQKLCIQALLNEQSMSEREKVLVAAALSVTQLIPTDADELLELKEALAAYGKEEGK